MSVISIICDGNDITDDVVFSDATFTSNAQGQPGSGQFRVKDMRDGPYIPGYFKIGQEVTLDVDGVRSWGGYIISVTRTYAFSVEDTTEPIRPRFWTIGLTDYNILFIKRVLYNKASPESALPMYYANRFDDLIILDIIEDLLDLGGDGLSTAGIDSIGTITDNEMWSPGNPGETWGTAMSLIAAKTGGIYYISPSKVITYHDANSVTGSFSLCDRPDSLPGSIGFREMTITSSALQMANEAFVWGAGIGSRDLAFAHVTDTASVSTHGLFQWADLRTDMWVQDSVDRRANTYIYGSPMNLRGHKDDLDSARLAIFQPGLVAGMRARVRSIIFGDWDDVIPVRSSTITFPTPTEARWDLDLSHELDVPYGIPDSWPRAPREQNRLNSPIPYEETFPFEGKDGDIAIGTIPPADSSEIHAASNRYLVMDNNPGGISIVPNSLVMKAGSWVSNNVPWPQTTCGVGLGAWGTHTTNRQCWYGVSIDDAERASRDIEIDLSSLHAAGVASAISVSVVAGDNPPTTWGVGAGIGSFDVSGPLITDGDTGREVEIPVIRVPGGLLTDGPNYIIFTPAWTCSAGYVCDISYWYPDSPLGGHGPEATGQFDSGSVTLPISINWRYVHPLLSDPDLTTWESPVPGSWEQPTPEFFSAKWATSYPYIPGSLEVYLAGVPLRKDIEFWETDPPTGRFQVSVPYDMRTADSITCRYLRADATQTTIDPNYDGGGSYSDPPLMDYPPEPGGVTGGLVYRPRFVSQLGYGTVHDGMNCVAASACVALDRHTLGWKHDTPPDVRAATGDTVGGLSLEQVHAALLSLHGVTLMTPGTFSYESFRYEINGGRGACISGDSHALVPWDLNARSEYTGTPFLGPHTIFVNEQRGDGYYYCYDPAFRVDSKYGISPGWYPPAAIRAYAASVTGDTNRIRAMFTRKTPRF